MRNVGLSGWMGIVAFIGLIFIPMRAFPVTVYQDFEDNISELADVENFGWGFNGTQVSLAYDPEPVKQGSVSWRVVVPGGQHLESGSGIPSKTEKFNFNSRPEENNRLVFWIWSDPSYSGDHTVMVKFFDQSGYKLNGVDVWTREKAGYRQWTQLHIDLDRLPKDFDFQHIDKIEIFNYWNGTYYYDDICFISQDVSEDISGTLQPSGNAVDPAGEMTLVKDLAGESNRDLKERNLEVLNLLIDEAVSPDD